jgi:class 3 adenylate cyclase
MVREGYRDVAVLLGGVGAWMAAGRAVEPLPDPEATGSIDWMELGFDQLVDDPGPAPFEANSVFLPRIAGQTFLEGRKLPLKQEMVALFVDMVGSTRLVFEHSPEEVLGIVQAFMQIVIDVAAYHCGDVHDFEGDGALVYFEGPGEAIMAAFQLRDDLLKRRGELPELPLPRLSLDCGPVVIGIVGTRFRQTVSLVGESVHTAARILKLAPPGGIVATDAIVTHARRSSPELAPSFALLAGGAAHLDPELASLVVWVSAPDPAALR